MVGQWLVVLDSCAEEGNDRERNLVEVEHQALEEGPLKYVQMSSRMWTACQALEEEEAAAAVVAH